MRHSLPLLIAAAALYAGAVIAAPVTDVDVQRANKRAEMQQKTFDRIDTNHDGKISRDEYKAWVDTRFDRLDANHDGVVDAAEMTDSPAAKASSQKRAEHFVKRYEENGSGKVTKADYEAKSMQRFDTLAAGGDTINAEQFAAGGKRRHRGPAATE